MSPEVLRSDRHDNNNFWQFYIITLAHITLIFLIQRVWRILKMTRHKEFAAVSGHHNADTAFRRFGNDVKSWHFFNILTSYLRMATMRHAKDIIETAEDWLRQIERLLLKNTKHLFSKGYLGTP